MSMRLFEELAAFVRVVEAGTYARASKRTQVPVSTLSRSVAKLEEELGIRLLQRNPRSMSLTPQGQALFDATCAHVQALSEGLAIAKDASREPVGLVRVTSSAAFGRIVLAPLVSHFLERYPKVRVDMLFVDRLVDLVDEGVDVAFRMGDLADSGLVGKRIGKMRRVLCASPLFLAKNGPIDHPNDLNGADGLAPSRPLLRLTLTHADDGEQRIELSPRLIASPLDALLPALLDGVGVAWMPEFSVYDLVRDGRLVEILPTWSLPAGAMTMLYPSHRGVSPAVSAFMAFASENYHKHLREAPRATLR